MGSKRNAAPAPAGNLITITLPLGTAPPGGYEPRDLHVEVRAGCRHQARAFRRLLAGLDDAGARLNNGKRVVSMADAIRWLADQIDHAAESA